MPDDTEGTRPGTPGAAQDQHDESWWSSYWERFRRQTVDEPIEDRREGMWDRFKRQDVDDPVEERRPRSSG